MELSEASKRILSRAASVADEAALPAITESALFVALADTGDTPVAATLREAIPGLSEFSETLRQRMRFVAVPGAGTTGGSPRFGAVLAPDVDRLLGAAAKSAEKMGAQSIEPILILYLLVSAPNSLPIRVLIETGVSIGGLRAAIRKQLAEGAGGGTGEPPRGPRAGPDKSALKAFGRDWVAAAREGRLGPIVGRKEELRGLARILGRQKKGNALIVGDPGVGKSSLVDGLALRLTEPGAALVIRDWRIVRIDPAELVAGAGVRGELESRVLALLEETAADPALILYIDDIAALFVGDPTVGNLLKSALARGSCRCVATTTSDDFQRVIDRDAALMRVFEILWLEPPETEECREILAALIPGLEKHHGVRFDDEAIGAAIELARALLPERRLPDMARDLLDQACSERRFETLTAATVEGELVVPVGRREVARVVSRMVDVPIDALVSTEADRLLHAEEILGETVFGQEEAISGLARAIRTARAGFGDPRRPIGVFVFAGPSGVGKTETARALARALFHQESRLIRFDMSEYMEAHSVARLIGSPPGYVGFDQGGLLVNSVRRYPSSVLLFDEIEKAHPRVADLFLQIFDDGTLTDSSGRKASFRNCVIILTTNLRPPEGYSGGPMGFGPVAVDSAREDLRSLLEGFFRPELLNRVTALMQFAQLDKNAVTLIIEMALRAVSQQALERNVRVEIDDEVVEHLYQSGYSEVEGARGLQKRVHDEVSHRIATTVLRANSAGRNPERITVRIEDGAIRAVEPDCGGEGRDPRHPYRTSE